MSRDETPDTTGLVHNHPPYRPVCNERLVDGQLRGACLASPDPAVVTPDAGEVPLDLRVAVADPGSILPRLPDETVAGWSVRAVLASDWLANYVAAAREAARAEVERLHALADTHREVAESMSAKWQEELDRADRLEAMCDRLAGDRVDREDAAEARAKAAEERLAGLVAKIEAEAARMSRAGGGIYTPDFIAGVLCAARIAEATS